MFTVKHLHRDRRVTVLYDDGDRERLILENKKWNHAANLSVSTSIVSNNIEKMRMVDNEPDVLEKLLVLFGNKSFMRYESQGLEQYVLQRAYDAEEGSFLKTVQILAVSDVPKTANVVNSHTLYNIKHEDDGKLKLKAMIDLHGNEDDLIKELTKDCSTCPPNGLQIIESITSLNGWSIYKADVGSAFLWTGSAAREVFVKPFVKVECDPLTCGYY